MDSLSSPENSERGYWSSFQSPSSWIGSSGTKGLSSQAAKITGGATASSSMGVTFHLSKGFISANVLSFGGCAAALARSFARARSLRRVLASQRAICERVSPESRTRASFSADVGYGLERCSWYHVLSTERASLLNRHEDARLLVVVASAVSLATEEPEVECVAEGVVHGSEHDYTIA